MRTAVLATLTVVALGPNPLRAQASYSVTLGPSFFRFTQSGVAPIVTARVTFELSQVLQVEPALGYLLGKYFSLSNNAVNSVSTAIFPEIALTLHPGRQRWTPFGSAGVGASIQGRGIAPRGVMFVSRVGMRYRVSSLFALTLSGQYRMLTADKGHTTDLVAGVSVIPYQY